ncbi:hypothetical protein [Brucella gallinifaecis]|uniref:hypothetical protein n=1 Tax=Brucella gallinifaecis TaxID=215590 RepID=UPI002361B89C|nr:hypothetical protein [Brucella gallinifaecis]
MEFRAPAVAQQQNSKAISYLTKNLKDPEAGRQQVEELIKDLGNVVDAFPDWHPILTMPPREGNSHVSSLSQLPIYKGCDHTVNFVRGFVTCPYDKVAADKMVAVINIIPGLHGYRLDDALYADNAYPVVVECSELELDADGTIKGRQALAWFVKLSSEEAFTSHVAETWWNVKECILGIPHGSRSSLFVNQHTGVHMRKIHEAMIASGMFGDIKESSLDMLSKKQQNAICTNLIRAAVEKWDKKSPSFEFEMRSKTCKAALKDTWDDDHEYSVSVEIGNHDLRVSGFYYPKKDEITHVPPKGKKALALKFI